MKRLLYLFQYLPLSIFIGVARSRGFDPDSWTIAFQYGALAGILQLIILIPILRNRLNRLIAGVNTFLIVGGAAFYFNNEVLLRLIDSLREAGVIFFVGIICIIATLFTPSGVFDDLHSKERLEKKYSLYFLVGIAIALVWSLGHRGNTALGGVVPFIFLVLLKLYFQRRLISLK